MQNLTALRLIIITIVSLTAGPVFGQGDGSWSTNAVTYRGLVGHHVTVHCPATRLLPPIWGTDVYTDDSSICAAGVHAGVITPYEGGTVTVEIRRGAPKFIGSSRNNIDSFGYGEWDGSFSVVIPKRKGKKADIACPNVIAVGVNRIPK